MDPSIEYSYVTEYSNMMINYLKKFTVKRSDLALKYETVNSARNYDLYIAAFTKRDSFESYDYSIEIFQQAGLTPQEVEDAWLYKMNVPKDKRQACVLLKRQEILTTFEESNDYYRMLMGLPATSDFQPVYLSEPVPGIDWTKPLYKMTDDEITILESMGIIDTLIKVNPTKPYLNYLGANKIDLIFARTANRFDILRSADFTNRKLSERFEVNYETSKAYIMNNFFRKRLTIDQEYFDSYIGYIILINALIMTTNDSIEIFNKREYYNELMIKEILKSYDLDIFNDIPLSYRKEIANNIESLIVSKGTDEVFFKIFKIFGFTDIIMRKYYLVKDHKKDINGDYIFEYETDGVTPKYDQMFSVDFSAVNILSDNIDAEIRKPENKIIYTDVTLQDIYWGGYESDEEIRQKLLKEDFNYIDTDYISIGTAYSLSDIMTEMSYATSTILALREYIEKLTFIEPLYGFTVDIFYAMTMLAAIMSKRVGFNGDILTDPADLAVLYKFNFERKLTEIQDIMNKYGYKADSDQFLLQSPTVPTDNVHDLVSLYFYNKDIYEKLLDLRFKTKDLKEYLVLQELIDYLTKSKLLSDIYTKKDGTIASTYLDFIADTNLTLATYIDNLTDDELEYAAFKLLSSLDDYFVTERFNFLFLKIPSLTGKHSIKQYMLKVINTFKSYTMTILALNISYRIDDKSNYIKLIDSMAFQGDITVHDNIIILDRSSVYSEMSARVNLRIRDELILI